MPADEYPLASTRAIVLAMTASIAEYRQALRWQHPLVVWAVGVHPADPHAVAAAAALDDTALAAPMMDAPVVGEIGLDGTGQTPMPAQRDLLSRLLAALHRTPRPTSLHSRRAVSETVDALRYAPPGVILHWWTGGRSATQAVLDAGCYISVNIAQARRIDLLTWLPRDRVLVETDHPYGGRSAPPGSVGAVEHALAETWGSSRGQVRHQVWRNFDQLLTDTGSRSVQSPFVQQLCMLARTS
ncbi:hypothetical protein GCM10018953_59240 [Streptosporangium nondiastaticum]